VKGFDETFTDFLISLPPLDSLALYLDSLSLNSNGLVPLHSVLEKHGPTLQSLVLATYESQTPNVTRQTFSVEQIDQIISSCPQLTHLALDVHRNGTWPNATLDALVAHPELTTLRIRVELGENMHLNEHPYTRSWTGQPFPVYEPIVTRGEAERLFHYLKEKKQGKPLEQVEIEVGDRPREGYMGPVFMESWPSFYKRFYRCGAGVVDEHFKQVRENSVDFDDFELGYGEFLRDDPFSPQSRYVGLDGEKAMCIAYGGEGDSFIPGFDEDPVAGKDWVDLASVQIGELLREMA
jgi:hypothetical protein